MNDKQEQPARAGQVQRPVMPRAYACYAANGDNIIMWSGDRARVEAVAENYGVPLVELYDPTAIAAAVAEERERCIKVCIDFGIEWYCENTTKEIASAIRDA